MLPNTYRRQFTTHRLRRAFFQEENIKPLEAVIRKEVCISDEIDDVSTDVSDVSMDTIRDHAPKLQSMVESLYDVPLHDMEVHDYKPLQWNRFNKVIGGSATVAAVTGAHSFHSAIHGMPGPALVSTAAAATATLTATTWFKVLLRSQAFFDDDIYLRTRKRDHVLSSILHESSHAVTKSRGLDGTRPYEVIGEGLASSAQHNLAHRLHVEDGEAGILKTAKATTLPRLEAGYRKLCHEYDQEPRELGVPDYFNVWRDDGDPLNKRQIGRCLVAIWELQHGDRVYKDIVHGNFDPGIDVYLEPGIDNAEAMVMK